MRHRSALDLFVAFSASGFMAGQASAQISETVINDNDLAVIYSLPDWGVAYNSNDYNGDEHYSNFTTSAPIYQVKGADVVVNFSGTGIEWVGRTGPNYGIASYSVDGGPAYSFDAYSANQIWRHTNAKIPGLSPGSHSLKIEVTPSANGASSDVHQVVDAFRILGKALPPSQGAVAGYNSPELTYAGAWDCGTDGNDLSGGHCWSGTAGASITWNFSGSLVEVFGRADLENGIFNVLIDGNQVGQVDGHFGDVNNDALNAYCLFTWKGAPGDHTIELVVTGTEDASASDLLLQFDEFIAFP
jgi:hypothetical protein